jgi:hypothetical protein
MLKTMGIDDEDRSKWGNFAPLEEGSAMGRIVRGQKTEKAATLVTLQPPAPAREPTAWMHAPSQPLMRSPLSQFQTPTAPRRISRFFRVRLPFKLP